MLFIVEAINPFVGLYQITFSTTNPNCCLRTPTITKTTTAAMTMMSHTGDDMCATVVVVDFLYAITSSSNELRLRTQRLVVK